MSRTSLSSAVGLLATIELIALWLLLPATRWHSTETRGALLGILVAFLVTGVLADRAARISVSNASIWATWPPVAGGVTWAVGGAAFVWFATELGGKWLFGLHALAAVMCTLLWLITFAAGRHLNATDRPHEVGTSNHAALLDAVAHVRAQLVRAHLVPAVTQRVQTILDRVSTLPRRPLPASLGSEIVERLYALVADLGERDPDLDSVLRPLEDVVQAAKRA